MALPDTTHPLDVAADWRVNVGEVDLSEHDAPRDDDEVGTLPILDLLTLERCNSIRPLYDYRPWPGQRPLT
jgi:hypothetical protein